LQGLLDSVPHDRGGYCTACFSSNYPIPCEPEFKKLQLENGIVAE
jgi:glutamine phosphoribosylpyrophosphate amidotransferase